MITRVVIVGGTGDLAGRYLLPGVRALFAAGYLDGPVDVVCADRTPDALADRPPLS